MQSRLTGGEGETPTTLIMRNYENIFPKKGGMEEAAHLLRLCPRLVRDDSGLVAVVDLVGLNLSKLL